MFDNETEKLIGLAPKLKGLDLDNLPKEFTKAYASIVAAKTRLKPNQADSPLDNDLEKLQRKMRRLASTYETFVSALPEQENRAAAAFVAASAHQVCLMASQLEKKERPPSFLNHSAISSDVATALLFLIAESSPDACEVAKNISDNVDDILESRLLKAIINLSRGKLTVLVKIEDPKKEYFHELPPSQRGTGALHLMLLQGVRSLAREMLDPEIYQRSEPDITSVGLFERVKQLAAGSEENPWTKDTSGLNFLFPGPWHLASLLLSVARDLLPCALVKLPPPSDVNPASWKKLLSREAKRRPFLWRNHRRAIEAKYLEPGVSAAVSFPTGAGKSTLAELKIGAALLRDEKVVFLAPTLALVDQTSKALERTFDGFEIQRESLDDLLAEGRSAGLPQIFVMTPEGCLARLTHSPADFENVGLIVFDECHLLHPRAVDQNRRALDAMFCLLNLTRIAPQSDLLLLSAMMKNTQEIADWIASLVKRNCISLDLTWKPTRQVRGSVVYEAGEIKELNKNLDLSRKSSKNKNPPAKLKEGLKVKPFGLFCLRQRWMTKARSDYALLPLLEDSVTLNTGTSPRGDWYLTPNSNHVASSIAAATASQNLKTLVFLQSTIFCDSASKEISEILGPSKILLREDEKKYYNEAVGELGGPEHTYLQLSSDGALESSCTCHHGLLLPSERKLHESIFKRKDGLNVLAATSTLAQGMNLPCEVVVIGGDRRFDPGANKMEQLEAHELLNAAGRAGRAGDSSQGLVLVVPSKVIDFEDSSSSINKYWTDLQAIFSQSDQCLEIDDPFNNLLDQVHLAAGASHETEEIRYMLSRLPLGESAEEIDEPATELLSRTFAAFKAHKKEQADWFNARVESVLLARKGLLSVTAAPSIIEKVSAETGVSKELLEALLSQLKEMSSLPDEIMIRIKSLLRWLGKNPSLFLMIIRRKALEDLLGKAFKDLTTPEKKSVYALPIIYKLLLLWMTGATLVELERNLETPKTKLGKCKKAREFVIDIVPELAYFFSLPSVLLKRLNEHSVEKIEVGLAYSTLGPCVRRGFDMPEKLALNHLKRLPRIATHDYFDELVQFIPEPSEQSFRATIRRVQEGIEAHNQRPQS